MNNTSQKEPLNYLRIDMRFETNKIWAFLKITRLLVWSALGTYYHSVASNSLLKVEQLDQPDIHMVVEPPFIVYGHSFNDVQHRLHMHISMEVRFSYKPWSLTDFSEYFILKTSKDVDVGKSGIHQICAPHYHTWLSICYLCPASFKTGSFTLFRVRFFLCSFH